MESEDLTHRQRSSYLSSCMVSPSCFPVHEEIEYSRIDYCGSNKRGRKWRNFLRRLVRDGKTMYGSKHLSFHYDAVSYSQNFDEGCHYEDSIRRPPVCQDVRWMRVPNENNCNRKNEEKISLVSCDMTHLRLVGVSGRCSHAFSVVCKIVPALP